MGRPRLDMDGFRNASGVMRVVFDSQYDVIVPSEIVSVGYRRVWNGEQVLPITKIPRPTHYDTVRVGTPGPVKIHRSSHDGVSRRSGEIGDRGPVWRLHDG